MMTKHEKPLRPRAAAAVLAMLAGLAVLILPGQHDAFAWGGGGAARLPPASPAAADCEGDACAEVAVTFDESRQQYRAVNNSADRWARVTASNVVASASACLAPGKDAYLSLKSITGAYHAAYVEARCGEEAASGPPAGE
jgi:hypothetical protein